MTIDTRKVTGRRNVHYDNFDELLADVEKMAGGEFGTLGNWSYGQIMRHLARSLDTAIDGAPFSFPKPFQFLMRLLMKKRFLSKPLPPGFSLPKKAAGLLPEETSVEEGLSEIRTAINRLKTDSHREPHPGFGKLTHNETDQFQLRHAELHMSFVIPASGQQNNIR